MNVLNEPVLILNKNWLAIRVKNVKKAIHLASRGRAAFIDGDDFRVYTWEEWITLVPEDDEPAIQTAKIRVKIPKVVVLTVFGKIPEQAPKFTRKNIFIRDNYTCQYTGKKVTMKDGDLDHIIPSSRGGKTEWPNVVVCSKEVNRKKRDRTPEEAGLKLKKKPIRPKSTDLMIDPNMKQIEYWKNFLHEKSN